MLVTQEIVAGPWASTRISASGPSPQERVVGESSRAVVLVADLGSSAAREVILLRIYENFTW